MEIIVSSVVCNKPCAKNDASPVVVELGTSPVEESVKRNSFSPIRNLPVGIVKIPTTEPDSSVLGRPIE